MTKHTNCPASSSASPILFTACNHTSPPTPLPSIKPVTGTRSTTPNFSFRCLSCDISYRKSSQNLVLDAYNGLIREQRARLYIAAERKGTEREGRYDDEMVAEGERRIRNWQIKRATEVVVIWKGFLERWNGGVSYEEGKEKVLWLALGVDGEGGHVVQGELSVLDV